MTLVQETSSAPPPPAAAGGCPVDHTPLSPKKATRPHYSTTPALNRDAQGVWHARSFADARAILRSDKTEQEGFGAPFVRRSKQMNLPILYQEGKAHQEQRKQTARFFTPKTVSTSYRQLMVQLADMLVGDLQRRRRADLSDMSLRLAVQVAGQVIGLTNSSVEGMAQRLSAFFEQPAVAGRSVWTARVQQVLSLIRLLSFYRLDVRPAIKARRQHAEEDLISHLLAQNYTEREILTECVTYAAAGMATTREFISMAAWHFLEHPDLRARYLAASEEARQTLLHEILRVEPVIAQLHRRATADMTLAQDGKTVVIPEGALIDIHIDAANADPVVVGTAPQAVCPERTLHGDRVGAPVLSFGDGHHRCPGNYIAIQETDIFLTRLLALPGLRIAQPPTVTWNVLTEGNELRHFILAVDSATEGSPDGRSR